MGGDSTLLLRAAGRSAQPPLHAGAAGLARRVRPRQRRPLRRARVQAYFVREVYDCVLPRLRRSWPIFQGADRHDLRAGVGARPRAGGARTARVLTYRDGVRTTSRAAITTARPRPRSREKLLRDFLDYRRTAVRDGETGPVREYVLLPGRRPVARRRLARPAGWRRASRCGAPTSRLHGGRARRSRRAPSSCRSRSPRAGWCATCSTRTSDGRGLREGAGAPAEEAAAPTRSTTSPAWSLPLAFDVECVRRSARAPRAASTRPCAAAAAAAAPRPRGGQGGLPAAVGLGDGRRRGRGARGRAQGARGRGGLHARRAARGRPAPRSCGSPRTRPTPASALGRIARRARRRGRGGRLGYVEEGMSLGQRARAPR